MYKKPIYRKTTIKGNSRIEGETIEQKVERIMEEKSPIKDGAPEIFTDRKDGVKAAYNIRTDKWEIATEAMDKIHSNEAAKGDGLPKMEVVKGKDDGEPEKIQGTTND